MSVVCRLSESSAFKRHSQKRSAVGRGAALRHAHKRAQGARLAHACFHSLRQLLCVAQQRSAACLRIRLCLMRTSTWPGRAQAAFLVSKGGATCGPCAGRSVPAGAARLPWQGPFPLVPDGLCIVQTVPRNTFGAAETPAACAAGNISAVKGRPRPRRCISSAPERSCFTLRPACMHVGAHRQRLLARAPGKSLLWCDKFQQRINCTWEAYADVALSSSARENTH